MVKNISIYCVTYNSYEALDLYYKSVKASAENCIEKFTIDFYVADNTEKDFKDINLEASPHIKTKVFAYHQNIGYFGAIRKMMLETNVGNYDYVILSNVDVKTDKKIFSTLFNYPTPKNCGWIAPQTISISEKRDLNPAVTTRYTANKLKMLRLLYKYPLLLELYKTTLYQRKKLSSRKATISCRKEIYAGHGSFIILTKEYFNRCGIINYPIFLYDEELYLAEECRAHGLKVIYEPCLKVIDIGKVSTGKMPSRFYCKCNQEGIEHILRKYYGINLQ